MQTDFFEKQPRQETHMLVTSLPISYKDNRPFRIMASSFITSILSKAVGARAIFPLNVVSIRGDNSEREDSRVQTYKRSLEKLGFLTPADSVIADTHPDFVAYAMQVIHESVQKGICEFKPANVCICACGKVEMLASIVDSLHETDQLQLIVKRNGKYVCRICASELSEVTKEVLLHHQGSTVSPEIFPDIYTKTLADKVKNLERKSYLVSRFRSGKEFQVNITPDLCIDPDFLAAIYLRYMSDLYGDRKIVLIVSASHLYRGSRAIAVMNNLGQRINASLVVHPMFDFAQGNVIFREDMSPDAFLEITESSVGLKLFLCTMLQWRRYKSVGNVDDLYLAKKTVRHLGKYQGPILDVPLSQAIPTLLCRINYLKVIKKVREGGLLTNDEMVLIRSVL